MAQVDNGLTQGANRHRARLADLLFRPFVYIAGLQSLLIGIAGILLAGLLGYLSNSHFDGVLDFHTGRPAALHLFLLEGLVDWLALSVVLLVAGKLVSRTAFRAVDLLGTQAMARWPTLLVAATSLAPQYQRLLAGLVAQLGGPAGQVAIRPADIGVGGLALLLMLLCIVWMVALMYQAYSLCCNVRGAKGAGSFVLALLAAEAISKVALIRLLTR
jgi:hypothetical protein